MAYHDSPRLPASIDNSYDIDKLRDYSDYLIIAETMCTPGTVAQIFIDGRTWHIKRLVGKFKQRTNVPYPYHYKKGLPYFLAKVETYRIVLTYPYRTAILDF